MTLYSAVEIWQAGRSDAQRSLTYLDVELEQLQAALSWNWHRLNIDHNVDLLQGEERLPVHPADAAFGGTEIALPARVVVLSRLTPAGIVLYRAGYLAGLDRETELLTAIARSQLQLETARTAMTNTERAAFAAAIDRARTAILHRHKEATSTPVAAGEWAVRIPGTNAWLPEAEEEGSIAAR